MKHERRPYNQTQRIDRQKANRVSVVYELPESGQEGDEVYIGTAPNGTLHKRIQGQWVAIGAPTETGEGGIVFAGEIQ